MFEIVTTDKSTTGSFKNVFCNVVVTESGEPISHNLAAGSVVRVDAPRVKPVAATAAPAAAPAAVAQTKE